jgi:ACR3 family arsenite efflux pump ArsB
MALGVTIGQFVDGAPAFIQRFDAGTINVPIAIGEIFTSVMIYLGIPLAAGFLSRLVLVAAKGEQWYQQVFLPRISPITLAALLFTIVVMFVLQGQAIVSSPADVVLIGLVHVALYFQRRYYGGRVDEQPVAAEAAAEACLDTQRVLDSVQRRS